MRVRNTLLIALAIMCIAAVSAFAEDAKKEETEKAKPYYPLTTCPVSGEALDEDALVLDVDGREVHLCCGGCKKKVLADKEKWMKKMDELIIAQQDKDYPLTTCPISGGELGGMGEPVKIVVGNYLVKLCCGGCEKGIRKDPDATIEKLSKFWSEKAMADACEHCEPGKPCPMHAEKECSQCEPGKPCAMHAEKACSHCQPGKPCPEHAK